MLLFVFAGPLLSAIFSPSERATLCGGGASLRCCPKEETAELVESAIRVHARPRTRM